LIRGTDYEEMSDRRRFWTLLAAAAVAMIGVIASATVPAARSAPPPTARDLAQIYFSKSFIRAEVVSFAGRNEHDFRIDEGRLVAVRPNAIDLLERDGTRQAIAIGAQTQIVGVGRLFAGAIARGTRVIAVRDGGGPAQQIRPSASARVLGRALFGNGLVRAEVLNYTGNTVHDYRIDEGRIVAVKPASMTLLERDGSRQSIPVSSSTLYTLSGQPVDQSGVVKGLLAITIREGDSPAEQVLLSNGPFVVRR
jgi:hypothetical protein